MRRLTVINKRAMATGALMLLFCSCSTAIVSLNPSAPASSRAAEAERVLASARGTLPLREEDIYRFKLALEDSQPKVRRAAIRLLGDDPRLDIYKTVLYMLDDPDADVRKEALITVLHGKIDKAPSMYEMAASGLLEQRELSALIKKFEQFGYPGVEYLIRMLENDEKSVWHEAGDALAKKYKHSDERLRRLRESSYSLDRISALRWLSRYQDDDALRLQLLFYDDGNALVRERAQETFEDMTEQALAPSLKFLRQNEFRESANIRVALIEKVCSLQAPEGMQYLSELFLSRDEQTQKNAHTYALNYGAHYLPTLRTLLKSNDERALLGGLKVAMEYQDVATVEAATPLLDSPYASVRALAQEYISNAFSYMKYRINAYYDPARNSQADRFILLLLVRNGAPEAVREPEADQISYTRLKMVFSLIPKVEWDLYVARQSSSRYKLALMALRTLYEAIRADTSASYSNNALVKLAQETVNIAVETDAMELTANKNLANSGSADGAALRRLRARKILSSLEWRKSAASANEPTRMAYRGYYASLQAIYDDYMAVGITERPIADRLLRDSGVNIDRIKIYLGCSLII